jgi:mRNA interferase HigB
MRIISKRTLRQFWEQHRRGREARTPLQVWHAIAADAEWSTPAEVNATYGDASILKSGRVVFNIGGNKFRLVAQINFHRRILFVRFVGTHAEYDRIDAETI